MPPFAANLAYLFTERPFIERFGAAAAAGFEAVELQLPYDQAPSAVRAELDRHGLIMLGINTPPGRAPGGEVGVAAIPGREAEFAALFHQAQIVGGDLIRRFEKHLAVVGHVQVAAVPTRHEPDEGEVNYPAIFDSLDGLGYRGFVGAEYRPRGRTEDGLAWARPYGVQPRKN